jgi:hypothetical protein
LPLPPFSRSGCWPVASIAIRNRFLAVIPPPLAPSRQCGPVATAVAFLPSSVVMSSKGYAQNQISRRECGWVSSRGAQFRIGSLTSASMICSARADSRETYIIVRQNGRRPWCRRQVFSQREEEMHAARHRYGRHHPSPSAPAARRANQFCFADFVCPVPFAKIFRFRRRANHLYNSRRPVP